MPEELTRWCRWCATEKEESITHRRYHHRMFGPARQGNQFEINCDPTLIASRDSGDRPATLCPVPEGGPFAILTLRRVRVLLLPIPRPLSRAVASTRTGTPRQMRHNQRKEGVGLSEEECRDRVRTLPTSSSLTKVCKLAGVIPPLPRARRLGG